jgi:hypothetical protein
MNRTAAVRTLVAAAGLAAWAGGARGQEMPLPEQKPGDRWVCRETDLLTQRELTAIAETALPHIADGASIDQTRFDKRTPRRIDPKSAALREQFETADGQPAQRGRSIATHDGACAHARPLKVGTRFEAIDTSAGRFEGLKLVARAYDNNETTGRSGPHERTIWFAPAVRREVSSEIFTRLRNGQPFRVEGREPTEFKPLS